MSVRVNVDVVAGVWWWWKGTKGRKCKSEREWVGGREGGKMQKRVRVGGREEEKTRVVAEREGGIKGERNVIRQRKKKKGNQKQGRSNDRTRDATSFTSSSLIHPSLTHRPPRPYPIAPNEV